MRHEEQSRSAFAATAAICFLLATSDQASAVEWVRQARLAPGVPVPRDYFGWSVSISGGTTLVGAYVDDDSDASVGAAYVYRRDGSDWSEVARLTPGNTGTEEDYFGESVSVGSNTAIVGAYMDDALGMDSGSAYVFKDNGAGWVKTAKLIPDDADASDRFGGSVSISGNTAIVGASHDDDNGGSGSAYIYRDSGSGFAQVAKLLPNDGEPLDYFGESVSISGRRTVVGAFGHADAAGAAYVFEDDGSGFSQIAKLTANDGSPQDWFGLSTAISADTVVVGAPAAGDSGLAYIFQHVGSSWTQVARLEPGGATTDSLFGCSVAVDGRRVIIGASSVDGSGAAYIIEDVTGGWTQTARLSPARPGAWDRFGRAVALSGDSAVVGASDGDFGAAAVYVVSEPDSVAIGDVNLDGNVNGLDVDPFVECLLDGAYQLEADMNRDHLVNGLDVDPFVATVVGSGAQQIPEPSTFVLATLCLLALLAQSHRRIAA